MFPIFGLNPLKNTVQFKVKEQYVGTNNNISELHVNVAEKFDYNLVIEFVFNTVHAVEDTHGVFSLVNT